MKMSDERREEVLEKVFSFDSDMDEKETSDWIEAQPDAKEIDQLITEILNLFSQKAQSENG